MATVANSAEENLCQTKTQTIPLDSDRPSHGRRFHSLTLNVKMAMYANFRQENKY